MSTTQPTLHVRATVREVLPQLGLAYAEDVDCRSWGITRSTGHQPLEQLQVGSAVMLTVEEHPQFAVATGWSLLS